MEGYVSAELYARVAEGFERTMDRLATLVEERNKAMRRVPKWISVNTCMPPADALVLLAGDDGIVDIGALDKDGHLGSPCIEEVTHWMPLPEPPKEDAHE